MMMTILDSHLHFHCIIFSFVPQCNLYRKNSCYIQQNSPQTNNKLFPTLVYECIKSNSHNNTKQWQAKNNHNDDDNIDKPEHTWWSGW